MRRPAAPTAEQQRAAFAARLAELEARVTRDQAELALVRHTLERLDGQPLDGPAVRRAHAARQTRKAGTR